jgi:hypothetical protein
LHRVLEFRVGEISEECIERAREERSRKEPGEGESPLKGMSSARARSEGRQSTKVVAGKETWCKRKDKQV